MKKTLLDVLILSGRPNDTRKLPKLWLRGAWMRDVVSWAVDRAWRIEVGSTESQISLGAQYLGT